MFSSLNQWIDQRVLRWRLARSRHVARYDDIPAALLPYWRRTASAEFAGIPEGAGFFARSLDGLLTYFDCVCAASAPCALPSRAADSVWHAWIASDPAGLKHFCMRHFRGVLPHIESGDMPGESSASLAPCLTAARRLEALPAGGLDLPALFTLDTRLRMPLGFHYVCVDGKIGYCMLDSRGYPLNKLHFPHALSLKGLAEAGMISEHEYKLALKLYARQRGPADPEDDTLATTTSGRRLCTAPIQLATPALRIAQVRVGSQVATAMQAAAIAAQIAAVAVAAAVAAVTDLASVNRQWASPAPLAVSGSSDS